MSTHDPLPAHLEQIGDQLVAAAERLYPTGRRRAWRGGASPRVFATLMRSPRLAIAGALASLAAVASVVVVLATAGAPPAYALTPNANGSYTITITDIATGLPALNIKLKQLGIDATAVPVTATCSAPIQIGGPGALTERIEAALSPTDVRSGPGGLLDLTPATIPAGSEGVIAAYQSPSGQINLILWTTTGSPPSCLNTRAVAPPSSATGNQR